MLMVSFFLIFIVYLHNTTSNYEVEKINKKLKLNDLIIHLCGILERKRRVGYLT